MTSFVFPSEVRGTTICVNRCPRCYTAFLGREKHCAQCMRAPLWDDFEAPRLGTAIKVYEFAGWRFERLDSREDLRLPVALTFLFCHKRFFNPEKPGEVYSQASFSDEDYCHLLYVGMPERMRDYKLKSTAAWLIAHWWEHYCDICPCLQGERNDAEESNFRRALINSLLWYDKVLNGWSL